MSLKTLEAGGWAVPVLGSPPSLASINNLSEKVRVGNHISYIRHAIGVKGLNYEY